LEFVKFTQAYFINWDAEMFYEPTQTPALARTSNLNEELGQIKYIFSDKTGTLTRNIMEFKRVSIAGTMYSASDSTKTEEESQLLSDLKSGKNAKEVENVLVLMAVCHTVIPEERGDGTFFNASSPDEKALVEGAARYGYEFLARKPDSVLLRAGVDGQTREYEVLNVIEFTSTRKRMTVIVREPNGTIRLFCKGADTMVMERLGSQIEHRRYQTDTVAHLEHFAQEGLRTLCLGTRIIDEEEYNVWARKYHAATTNLEDKQNEIDKVAELIERELTLLGATAIEDKLQDGVPETIAQLLEAGIHVWVLTGDKQETAINIGHSCRLLREGMPILIINSDTLDETREEIRQHLDGLRQEGAIGQDNAVAIVVDGRTLTFALDHSLRSDFLDLCSSCQSVICCRVSPIQKAEMVELVQENTGAISLAIGDGANDVAMIQKADVGVGISGNEGLQAANSSDFAIAQFRYLSRLLFVHGAWNYTRISKVILYSFYKNICLYIIELWFALYNYWTGQVLFERWTIGES
jgi:phospholipid-transporting ATPase